MPNPETEPQIEKDRNDRRPRGPRYELGSVLLRVAVVVVGGGGGGLLNPQEALAQSLNPTNPLNQTPNTGILGYEKPQPPYTINPTNPDLGEQQDDPTRHFYDLLPLLLRGDNGEKIINSIEVLEMGRPGSVGSGSNYPEAGIYVWNGTSYENPEEFAQAIQRTFSKTFEGIEDDAERQIAINGATATMQELLNKFGTVVHFLAMGHGLSGEYNWPENIVGFEDGAEIRIQNPNGSEVAINLSWQARQPRGNPSIVFFDERGIPLAFKLYAKDHNQDPELGHATFSYNGLTLSPSGGENPSVGMIALGKTGTMVTYEITGQGLISIGDGRAIIINEGDTILIDYATGTWYLLKTDGSQAQLNRLNPNEEISRNPYSVSPESRRQVLGASPRINPEDPNPQPPQRPTRRSQGKLEQHNGHNKRRKEALQKNLELK